MIRSPLQNFREVRGREACQFGLVELAHVVRLAMRFGQSMNGGELMA